VQRKRNSAEEAQQCRGSATVQRKRNSAEEAQQCRGSATVQRKRNSAEEAQQCRGSATVQRKRNSAEEAQQCRGSATVQRKRNSAEEAQQCRGSATVQRKRTPSALQPSESSSDPAPRVLRAPPAVRSKPRITPPRHCPRKPSAGVPGVPRPWPAGGDLAGEDGQPVTWRGEWRSSLCRGRPGWQGQRGAAFPTTNTARNTTQPHTAIFER